MLNIIDDITGSSLETINSEPLASSIILADQHYELSVHAFRILPVLGIKLYIGVPVNRNPKLAG